MAHGGNRLPHDWEASYADTPPWDIGRPQAAFVGLRDAGRLRGRVLDVGCGTGEHALLAAAHGLSATGVDVSPTAIDRARAKAAERGLDVRFVAQDVLAMDAASGRFDTILDCGFLHVLSDPDRARFVEVLRQVLGSGGTYHMLCFSDRVPGDDGPRRLSQDEIRSVFAEGFIVEAIDEAGIEATFLDHPVPAWLARVTRGTSSA